MDLHAYPGEYEPTIFDQVPAWRFRPGTNGYARFVTRRHYVPPIRIAGWLQLRETEADVGPLDGIHIHVGHIGNARNYVASLLRKDGHAKVAVEYGWRGYLTLDALWDAGPDFVFRRVYHYEVVWERNRIRTWTANELGVWEMDAEIPETRVIPFGAVGFRLDNVEAVGNFTVRQL